MKQLLPVLLLLLAIGGLTFVCANVSGPAIEADLTSRTRAALDPLNISALSVSASGLDVTLSGEVSTDEARLQAGDAARRVYGVEEIHNRITIVSQRIQAPLSALTPAAASCQAEFSSLLEKDQVQFLTGSASLNPASLQLLEKLAAVAAKCPASFFEVAGFPDAEGPAAANPLLSKLRADVVMQYLARRGVLASRMTARGGIRNSQIEIVVQ